MAQSTPLPAAAPRNPNSEIDAVLEQMFGYFSRDLPKRPAPAAPNRQ
ncbi:hypothetical protein [Paracoccus seriniphilus]|nr:hypothetical protein [Paracoccus seriniphilus]